MAARAQILHLDLDAFFAAVEQRDKPSLRSKPVVVGGSGPRGVVATASYEAREYGVRSAMSGSQARHLCPHAAFLGGRFEAYRQSSEVVMGLLRELSPVVEPLSFDEAYVDLAASQWRWAELPERVQWLRAELTRRTAGLTGSVGVGSSKLIAKLASEDAKPDGQRIVEPAQELEFISGLPVRALPGVGPVAERRLVGIGIERVAQLREADSTEVIRELGAAMGSQIFELAHARDPRLVSAEREAKSISTEQTFAADVRDRAQLVGLLRQDSRGLARRLREASLFARSVVLKVRFQDFTTVTKSRSLGGATDDEEVLFAAAHDLFDEVELTSGVRLLGLGVSGFTQSAQEALFELPMVAQEPVTSSDTASSGVRGRGYFAGADVVHAEYGRGWVWGSGLGRVTVRFETRDSGVGPVRTFAVADPQLQPADELPELPV